MDSSMDFSEENLSSIIKLEPEEIEENYVECPLEEREKLVLEQPPIQIKNEPSMDFSEENLTSIIKLEPEEIVENYVECPLEEGDKLSPDQPQIQIKTEKAGELLMYSEQFVTFSSPPAQHVLTAQHVEKSKRGRPRKPDHLKVKEAKTKTRVPKLADLESSERVTFEPTTPRQFAMIRQHTALRRQHVDTLRPVVCKPCFVRLDRAEVTSYFKRKRAEKKRLRQEKCAKLKHSEHSTVSNNEQKQISLFIDNSCKNIKKCKNESDVSNNDNMKNIYTKSNSRDGKVIDLPAVSALNDFESVFKAKCKKYLSKNITQKSLFETKTNDEANCSKLCTLNLETQIRHKNLKTNYDKNSQRSGLNLSCKQLKKLENTSKLMYSKIHDKHIASSSDSSKISPKNVKNCNDATKQIKMLVSSEINKQSYSKKIEMSECNSNSKIVDTTKQIHSKSDITKHSPIKNTETSECKIKFNIVHKNADYTKQIKTKMSVLSEIRKQSPSNKNSTLKRKSSTLKDFGVTEYEASKKNTSMERKSYTIEDFHKNKNEGNEKNNSEMSECKSSSKIIHKNVDTTKQIKNKISVLSEILKQSPSKKKNVVKHRSSSKLTLKDKTEAIRDAYEQEIDLMKNICTNKKKSHSSNRNAVDLPQVPVLNDIDSLFKSKCAKFLNKNIKKKCLFDVTSNSSQILENHSDLKTDCSQIRSKNIASYYSQSKTCVSNSENSKILGSSSKLMSSKIHCNKHLSESSKNVKSCIDSKLQTSSNLITKNSKILENSSKISFSKNKQTSDLEKLVNKSQISYDKSDKNKLEIVAVIGNKRERTSDDCDSLLVKKVKSEEEIKKSEDLLVCYKSSLELANTISSQETQKVQKSPLKNVHKIQDSKPKCSKNVSLDSKLKNSELESLKSIPISPESEYKNVKKLPFDPKTISPELESLKSIPISPESESKNLKKLLLDPKTKSSEVEPLKSIPESLNLENVPLNSLASLESVPKSPNPGSSSIESKPNNSENLPFESKSISPEIESLDSVSNSPVREPFESELVPINSEVQNPEIDSNLNINESTSENLENLENHKTNKNEENLIKTVEKIKQTKPNTMNIKTKFLPKRNIIKVDKLSYTGNPINVRKRMRRPVTVTEQFCPVCEKYVINLHNHIKIAHKSQLVQYSYKYHHHKCSNCDKCTKSIYKLLQHIPNCLKTNGYIPEPPLFSGDSVCEFCGRQILPKNNPENIELHLKYCTHRKMNIINNEHNYWQNTQKLNYQCVYCYLKLESKLDLLKHINEECENMIKFLDSEVRKENSQRKCSKSENLVSCRLCHELFTMESILQHVCFKKYPPVPSYLNKCKICQKLYALNKGLFNEHNLKCEFRVHVTKRNKCEYCEDIFDSKISLLKHAKNCKKKQCTYCKSYYSCTRVLNRHITYCRKKPRLIICEFCETYFTVRGDFEKHIELECKKSPNLRYIIECKMCKLKFKTEELFEKHQEICIAKFIKENVISRIDSNCYVPHFECGICLNVYENKELLELHQEKCVAEFHRQKRNSILNSICGCKKSFSSHKALKEHRKYCIAELIYDLESSNIAESNHIENYVDNITHVENCVESDNSLILSEKITVKNEKNIFCDCNNVESDLNVILAEKMIENIEENVCFVNNNVEFNVKSETVDTHVEFNNVPFTVESRGADVEIEEFDEQNVKYLWADNSDVEFVINIENIFGKKATSICIDNKTTDLKNKCENVEITNSTVTNNVEFSSTKSPPISIVNVENETSNLKIKCKNVEAINSTLINNVESTGRNVEFSASKSPQISNVECETFDLKIKSENVETTYSTLM